MGVGKQALRALLPIVAVAALAVLLAGFHHAVAVPAFTAAANGGTPFLSGPLSSLHAEDLDRGGAALARYEFQRELTQLWLVVLGAVLAAAAWRFRDALRAHLREYFAAEDTPLNLALLRVAIFGYLVFHLRWSEVQFALQLHPDLANPVFGLEPAASILRAHPAAAEWLHRLFVASALAAALGAATRVTTWTATLSAWALLALVQTVGKIVHVNHLVWFGLLLACSRCGDALSVDSVWRAFRNADRGLVAPPPAARGYALPLRFAWILVGVLYFFPGFWKIWEGGAAWIFGDQFKLILHREWAKFPDWSPAFRMDQYPLLYRGAAASGVLFELLFIAAVFHPLARAGAAVVGLSFHNLTGLLLNIKFGFLQIAYVAFVNWQMLLRRLGRRLFPVDLFILYDGNCGICRRTVALLWSIDFVGRTRYVNALDPAALAKAELHGFEAEALATDMHAVRGKDVWRGYDAYRCLAARNVLLWPLVPVMMLGPVRWIGERIYRRVADSRACRVPSPAQRLLAAHAAPDVRPVLAAGALLVALNAGAGVLQIEKAFPFACYPTFASPVRDHSRWLSIEIVSADGARLRVVDFVAQRDLLDAIPSPRFVALASELAGLKEREGRDAKTALYVELLRANGLALAPGDTVRCFRELRANDPALAAGAPLERTLLWQRRAGSEGLE